MQVLAPLKPGRTSRLWLCVLAAACALPGLGCRRTQPPEAANAVGQKSMEAIGRSNLAASVPPAAQFARLMKRDLTSHFKMSTGRPVAVEYEMLRQGPTQAGAGLPKYYVWVRVLERKKVLTEGAARVAAQSASRFEVTDYLSKSMLRQNPARIAETFPPALMPAIQKRLK